MRGRLTPEIQERAEALLGRKIDTTELRLMPYLQFTMMNSRRLDPRKMNQLDRSVMSMWRAEGHVTGGAGEDMTITRKFWDAINDILFHSYVNPQST